MCCSGSYGSSDGYKAVSRFTMAEQYQSSISKEILGNDTPCFEDDGAVYLVTEFVDGIGMNEIDDSTAKRIVEKELQEHVEALKELKSNVWGGPDGLVGRNSVVKGSSLTWLRSCHRTVS